MNFQLTEEMQEAIQLINGGERCVYITGKAGTGKTTFLKYLIKNLKKNVVVAASTGVAAINAGGMTLHSLLSIPMGMVATQQAKYRKMNPIRANVLKRIDVLIIDEISMVRVDVIDYVNWRLRQVRDNDEPFGGVQIIMFGDLYQLPPVVKKKEKKALNIYYQHPYFFCADVFKRCPFRIVELTHVFRQTDENFVRLLNNIRNYTLTFDDAERLKNICNVRECSDFSTNRIHICSLRSEVAKINEEQLGEPTHVFAAVFQGDFMHGAYPCDADLKIRIGARVMMLKNDPDLRYYNGSLGTVTRIVPEYISVALDSGITVDIGRFSWKSYEYETEDGKVVAKERGSCEQFPITLAWAITIHKSQGLTFDQVAIHAHQIFAPGQIYVALSRCRSLEGVVTDTYITRRHILPNRMLVAFEDAYKDNGYLFDERTRAQIEKI